MPMTLRDTASWLIVGAVLFLAGLFAWVSGYSLLTFFGALAILLGLTSMLVGALGFPQLSGTPSRT